MSQDEERVWHICTATSHQLLSLCSHLCDTSQNHQKTDSPEHGVELPRTKSHLTHKRRRSLNPVLCDMMIVGLPSSHDATTSYQIVRSRSMRLSTKHALDLRSHLAVECTIACRNLTFQALYHEVEQDDISSFICISFVKRRNSTKVCLGTFRIAS